MEDTIVALSSAHGRSAIAVIRLSGRDSLSLLRGAFDSDIEPRKAAYGKLDVERVKDDIVALYFKAPKSFTGEDVVEIYCHGSAVITQAVIRYFIEKGARLANKGEFTRRAFENGKITLSESEGIIDLIDSASESGARAAYNLASGALSKELEDVKKSLIEISASVNVEIDYPEEDVGASSDKENLAFVEKAIAKVEKLEASYDSGKKIASGVNVVLGGVPNAGKSTLLNALVGFERAIVTDEAGTTRDTVEASYVYKDVLFNVTDTAGVRDGELSKAESLGIERSLYALQRADVAVLLDDFDCDCEHKIFIHAKADLGRKKDVLNVSAEKGEGIEELKERIYEESSVVVGDEVMLTNLRQYEAIRTVKESLIRTKEAMTANEPAEAVAFELFGALAALSEMDGVTATREVVDAIFSRFCVGK
ncbi:MAG: tRNA uridine-5-carboxymethylaminomethyl(34) synthesis GTPase MnmE [Clostridia bacterium]|nr:tRNA uridine-5-carboxymethylaminomethyl(34) synthesis GTPase MnmE [Clostridia bacterium]